MILAQITDSHIEAAGVLTYGIFDAAASLAKVVDAINARAPQPDLVVHTGDLVHHGAPEQYGPARAILDGLRAPYVAIPGNHDNREGFAAAFADTAWLPKSGEFLHFVVDQHPVRLVCLDTVIPEATDGALCAARLAWLEQQLAAAPDRPTVVACHHPPFISGLTGVTGRGLAEGGEAFAAILADSPQVVRLICGHEHRPMAATFGGRAAWVGTATGFQFAALTSPERVLAITREPPGYSLHLMVDDPVGGAQMVSHSVPVGDFGDPIELLRDGERVLPR